MKICVIFIKELNDMNDNITYISVCHYEIRQIVEMHIIFSETLASILAYVNR